MRDPDRPRIEMTPAIVEEQERLDTLAALVAFYLSALRQWDVPEVLRNELVASWQESYLGRD